MRKDRIYSSILRKKYNDWEDLRDHLENAPTDKITMCLNKNLLNRHTLDELVEIANAENIRLGSNDFRKVERIRGHISWLEDRGWIISAEPKI